MNNPFISAIIVVYRSENYINKCIVSLQNAALYAKIKLEIIIIVNDSENKKYPFFKKNIRILKNKSNIGFAKSANQGVSIAKGDWLLFANPDTVTRIETLSELIIYCNSEIGIIAPKILNRDGSLQPNILRDVSIKNMISEQSYLYKIFPNAFRDPQADKSFYQKNRYLSFVSNVYVLVRKKAFIDINGYDERFFVYFEDIDLCRKMRNSGYRILYNPRAVVTHIGHQSSSDVIRGGLFIDSLTRYCLKYHSLFYTHLVLFLFFLGCLARLVYWNFKLLFTYDNTLRYLAKSKIIFCSGVVEIYFNYLFCNSKENK